MLGSVAMLFSLRAEHVEGRCGGENGEVVRKNGEKDGDDHEDEDDYEDDDEDDDEDDEDEDEEREDMGKGGECGRSSWYGD